MVTLIVLFIGTLAAAAFGWAGLALFSNPVSWVRGGLALMFVFTGVSHFTKVRFDMVKMVPRSFAEPMAMVYFTGVCEILGAAGLLVPGTRAVAAICLVVLLVAMFPANVRAARENILIGGRPPTPLAPRAAMQVLFIGLLLWSGIAGG